jgi:hypothetical protein
VLPDLVALEETLLKYGFPLNQQLPIPATPKEESLPLSPSHEEHQERKRRQKSARSELMD